MPRQGLVPQEEAANGRYVNMQEDALKNIRILWLDNGECILFNSSRKRISRVCGTKLGAAIERMKCGTNINDAAKELSENEVKEAERLIEELGGGALPQVPLGKGEKRFYKTLTLAPSANCNLRCIYCSGDAGERKNQVMDWNMARSAIDYFFGHCYETGPYTLQFHGAGEPMTAPEIVRQSVEYARKHASKKHQILYTRISTNGVISEEQAVWLSENMNHISLSLDGNAYFHDEQRPLKNGNPSYEIVLRSLRIFKKKNALKRINIVVTNEGIDALLSNLKHIHDLCGNIDVRVLPMESCGRSKKKNLTPINREYFQERLDDILEDAEKLGIHILTAVEQMEYCTNYYCQACGYAMCVTPAGEVSTCVEAMTLGEAGTDELFVGSYDRVTGQFEIDWNKVEHLRGRSYDRLETCKDCSFATNCAGSCLIRAARKHGTVFAIDETACAMVKLVLTNQMKRLAVAENEITFQKMQELSLEVHRQFEKIEMRSWGIEAAMIELSKQVGDLSKLVLSQENYYLASRQQSSKYQSSRERIGNELADILHWLIWIADYYGVSIPQMHMEARRDELGYIKENLNQGDLEK